MIKKTIIFIIFILSCGICQVTVNKQLFLQDKERYYLDLSNYYDKFATDFVWPEVSDTFEINQPLINLGDLTTNLVEPPDFIAASFTDGNAKYQTGITSKFISTNNYEIYLSISTVSMNNEGVIAFNYVYSLMIDQLGTPLTSVKCSMFNKYEGFLTYALPNNKFRTIKFYYNETQQIIKYDVISINLQTHLSVQGPDQSVYVIQQSAGAAVLMKYDSKGTKLDVVDTYNIGQFLFNQNYIVIDQGRYFMAYQNRISSIFYAYVLFDSDTIGVGLIPVPSFGTRNILQRINSSIMIISDNTVYEIRQQNFININTLTLKSSYVLPFTMSSPVFLNQNLIVNVKERLEIEIINVQKKTIVYGNIPNANQRILSLYTIGDQVLVYLYKKDDNNNYVLNQISPYKVQFPSLVLIGNEQQLKVVITTGLDDVTYTLNISVTVTQQPKLVFEQSSVPLQNTIGVVSDQQYLIPIEKYVTGSNIQLAINFGDYTKAFFSNPQLIKLQQLNPIDYTGYSSSSTVYLTDNFFSALIQQKQESQYILSLVVPVKNNLSSAVITYKNDAKLKFPINQIDNQGSFTLQNGQQKPTQTIFLPQIFQEKFIMNEIEVDCDTSQVNNFIFASDISQSVVIIRCGSKLIQYNFQPSKQYIYGVTIISSNQILSTLDATKYTDMICIGGTLFISKSDTIVAYDYINNGQIGNPLTITPINQNPQTLTIFSTTFLLSTKDDQNNAIVVQYSYNNFQTGAASKLRQLQNIGIDPTGKILVIRNDDEYVLIPSPAQSKQYYLYRINQLQTYSQNQLYTTVTLDISNSIPIINSSLICSLNNQFQCNLILKSASIAYKFTCQQQGFNEALNFPLSFTLNDAATQAQQQYTLNIQRNVQPTYGVLDQQAEGIQNLKTQSQDSNWVGSKIFTFDDSDAFNANLLGWQLIQGGTVKNRLQQEYTTISDQSLILFNILAVVSSDKVTLTNVMDITGSFDNNCFVFDDKASVQIQSDSVQQFVLYVLCSQTLFKYEVELTKDTQSGKISGTVNNPKQYSFSDNQDFSGYSRLVTVDKQIQLFNVYGNIQAIISINDTNALLSQLVTTDFSQSTQYYLNSLKIYLQIYKTGQILISQIGSDKVNSVTNIYDLLSSQQQIVENTKMIQTIDQYSDTQMRVSFYNHTSIYDITLSLDDKSNLILSKAQNYCIIDSIQDSYVYGFKNNKYTLFAFTSQNSVTVTLYDTQDYSKQYLTKSSVILPFTSSYFVKSMQSNADGTQIALSLSSQQLFTITILNNVTFELEKPDSSTQKQLVKFRPQGQQVSSNEVNFYIQGSSTNPASTSSSLKQLSVIILIGMLILFN